MAHRRDRLVTLDLLPGEAMILMELLEALQHLSGGDLGHPVQRVIDETLVHLRLQLQQLQSPPGNKAPYPV